MKLELLLGGIISGINITLQTGPQIRLGTGNDATVKLVIPKNYAILGFFGGTNGHLHNLGVHQIKIVDSVTTATFDEAL